LFGRFKVKSVDDWQKPWRQKLSAKLSKGTRGISEKRGTRGDCFWFASPNIHPCSQRWLETNGSWQRKGSIAGLGMIAT